MPAYRRTNGGWVNYNQAIKRSQGGSMVACQNGYRRTGGTWVRFWHNNVTGSVSPAQFQGSLSGTGPSGQVQTYVVTATGAGGSGSYTYSWSILSVSNGVAPTLSNPNSAGTSMSRNVTAGVDTVTGYARCTITDANGSSSTYVDVPYSLSYSNRN
jgi:hypothetical protein